MASIDPMVVFVVGCPRSGTTLVGELIASSTNVYNARESFLIDRVHSWQEMSALTSPLAKQFVLRGEALVQELIREAATSCGRTHVVDHTPWHALYLAHIWRLFPRARVVNVVRHPASVVSSLERSHAAGYLWAGATTHDRVALWKHFIDSMAQHPQDDRVRHIRYEDLCTDPTAVAQSLFDWLSLPWQDSYLEAFARPHAPNPGSAFALATKRDAELCFNDAPAIPQVAHVDSALRELAHEQLRALNYQVVDA